MDTERYMELLKNDILDSYGKMIREPSGILRYPYITPSASDSPYYSDTLWDWDSWLTSVMMGQAETDSGKVGQFRLYEQGSILNFLALCTEDGYMPI